MTISTILTLEERSYNY